MKKILTAMALCAAPTFGWAQSAVDAYNLSQTDMRGTARFMGMGGAFTALGGDLSSITQNPAGLGVYRRSEIGVTVDLSPRSITAKSPDDQVTQRNTKFFCNNFGYVGVARLNGAMNSVAWGVSYNRLSSLDRKFSAYQGASPSSLTNYIANYTTNSGVSPADMDFREGYNPYLDSDVDWLSILAYNSLLINPVNGRYAGLAQNGTVMDSQTQVHQTGYIDEYAIDFGGNVEDVFQWGVGVGIMDLSMNSTTVYSEGFDHGYIPAAEGYMTNGSAQYWLSNYRVISGTGVNVKAGIIVRPINEFRIGAAVHTPTWYSLSSNQYGAVEAHFKPDNGGGRIDVDDDYTDDAYYNFKLNSPWKFMVGAAAVIGNQAIVSLDYERQDYGGMKVKYQNRWGSYEDDEYVNGDIKNYYKATNILRLGLEYRATSRLSLRAGYNVSTTNCRQEMLDDREEVYTAGTNPSYVMNKQTNAVSLGLGYRWRTCYLDGAYVWRKREAEYKAFTPYGNVATPGAALGEVTNDIVVTFGVRF